ncbi:hypothetical protein PIB30_055579 [Stylosanthes scabra]|uniref:Reverse transcriptase domain-containing protein n=1 Tax=Stylosanthes scabra TaxID=79078 RepID=A0ABU6SJT1_9FABA|nr:hypothetical protein [Stylosanthes scabra]
MALVKGLKEDTPFMKSLTKRPPKTMEEIQERSHDYLQQEEGQTVVKTDRNKKDNPRKEHFRDDTRRKEHRSNRSYYNPLNVSLAQFLNEVSQVERVPAPRPIKNTSREDRRSYWLKNGRFHEYTGRNRNKDDERRVRQRQNSPETKAERRRDEPKEHSAHREIAMISGGIPDEGNPPSKKAAKRNKHSCLAVEVMPRPLVGNPPLAIVLSSEEIRQTTSNMNQPLVISASTINTKIRRVFVDQGSSADILFRRCFDALDLTESYWKHTPTT